MSNNFITPIQFTFTNGVLLTTKEKTFKEALQYANSLRDAKIVPIKILFPSTNKLLYFDDNIIQAFLNDEINQQDLIDSTQCDALCRNNIPLLLGNNTKIEVGSLFKKIGNICVLISDDEHIETKYSEIFFYFA